MWFESRRGDGSATDRHYVMRRRELSDFPSWTDAPLALLTRDGHCGLLAAWVVLRHFRKRTSSAQLIKDVAHSNKHGAFTIGIAHALAKAGLRVRFHTDLDPDPKPIERRLYRMAERQGAAILPAVEVSTLLASVRAGSIPVVFYNVDDGSGHF